MQKNEEWSSPKSLDFEEIDAGLGTREAIAEARRCLNCPKPLCRTGCPIENDIPGFIQALSKGNIGDARDILALRSNLPAVCGRVCPHEKQCEAHCVLMKKDQGIAIGKLERFVADFDAEMNLERRQIPLKTEGKVAVIGSGPAGLTVAGDLAKEGFHVVVYEAEGEAGGVLLYGIPQFRLPKQVVRREVERIASLGVTFITRCLVGVDVTVDQLFAQGFDAIFIGTGTALAKELDLPGKELQGIVQSSYFLRTATLCHEGELPEREVPVTKGEQVLVIGAGNVAMDAARCAKRLGAEVYIVYRRSEQEMPARHEEIEHAKEEGIILKVLNNPIAIKGDEKGWVNGIECVEMELGEPDASGRRRPIEKAGSEHVLDVDCVIMSIGTKPNPLIISTTQGLESNKWGCIVADEATGQTSKQGVYAGGDAVTGAATVILAMGAGKAAAKAMNEYLKAL